MFLQGGLRAYSVVRNSQESFVFARSRRSFGATVLSSLTIHLRTWIQLLVLWRGEEFLGFGCALKWGRIFGIRVGGFPAQCNIAGCVSVHHEKTQCCSISVTRGGFNCLYLWRLELPERLSGDVVSGSVSDGISGGEHQPAFRRHHHFVRLLLLKPCQDFS